MVDMGAQGIGLIFQHAFLNPLLGNDVVQFDVIATTASDDELEMMGLVRQAGIYTWFRKLEEVDYPVLEWPEFDNAQSVGDSLSVWMTCNEKLRLVTSTMDEEQIKELFKEHEESRIRLSSIRMSLSSSDSTEPEKEEGGGETEGIIYGWEEQKGEGGASGRSYREFEEEKGGRPVERPVVRETGVTARGGTVTPSVRESMGNTQLGVREDDAFAGATQQEPLNEIGGESTREV
jgi:hypothetical protein